MKKNIKIFIAGLITYWLIGGLFLYFTGSSPAEHIAFFLESIFG